MTRPLTRLLPLLALLLVGLTACSEALPTSGPVRAVTVEQAVALIADEPARTIIDLRTPEEYAEGHLEGAVLINFYDDDFEEQIAALDRDAPYLIHCAQGGRSGSAGGIMQELGFSDVADMTPGFNGWLAADLPFQTG